MLCAKNRIEVLSVVELTRSHSVFTVLGRLHKGFLGCPKSTFWRWKRIVLVVEMELLPAGHGFSAFGANWLPRRRPHFVRWLRPPRFDVDEYPTDYGGRVDLL
ncbi:unnamed protein product [Nippostrongylus brasiliensis]|uniref:Uncharacterized protein n=1 Tax=Nippostrongylus brasiliensis TaxID=27835 RepID=A0A0N4YAJ7_NIPBR|nr:unnamed protein product [Nippostrongylus brasiliensis]